MKYLLSHVNVTLPKPSPREEHKHAHTSWRKQIQKDSGEQCFIKKAPNFGAKSLKNYIIAFRK